MVAAVGSPNKHSLMVAADHTNTPLQLPLSGSPSKHPLFVITQPNTPLFIFLNNPKSKEKKTSDESGGVGIGGVVTVAGGDEWRWWCFCGEVAAVVVVVEVVPAGEKGRVRDSGVEERIDRETSNLFGFAGKIPLEKFSGGGVVAAAGGQPAGAAAGCGEWGEIPR
nr:hypothetical protein [Tanacetum cinerariifolium]